MKNCELFIFALKHRSWVHLRTSHDLCFRAKIRKNVYPCKPKFYYLKEGCKGVYISQTCYPDGLILIPLSSIEDITFMRKPLFRNFKSIFIFRYNNLFILRYSFRRREPSRWSWEDWDRQNPLPNSACCWMNTSHVPLSQPQR